MAHSLPGGRILLINAQAGLFGKVFSFLKMLGSAIIQKVFVCYVTTVCNQILHGVNYITLSFEFRKIPGPRKIIQTNILLDIICKSAA